MPVESEVEHFIAFCCNMKKSLLTYIFLFYLLSLFSQITFQKKYDFNTGIIRDGSQLPNGNYVIGYDEKEGNDRAVVFSTDAFGEVEWAQQINATEESRVQKMAASEQNDIYLLIDVGVDILMQSKLILIKLNDQGQKIWDIYLGENFNDSQDLFVAENGNILVSINQPFGDFRIVKVNANGAIVWTKGFANNAASHITQINEDSTGNYLLMGRGEHPMITGELITHILKISPNGEPIFSKSYNFPHPINLDYFANGEMIITGFVPNDNREFLMRLNTSGDILWANIMDSPFNIAGAYITNEDDLFLSGIYDGPGIVCMMKMDGTGTINWERGYVGGYTDFRLGFETEDGYAILGKSTIPGVTGGLFYKTDKNGLIAGCEHFNICSSLEPLQIDTMSFGWTAFDFTIDTDAEIDLMPIQITAENFCEPAIIPDPFFNVPDTVCQNSFISFNNLAQVNADAWQWSFAGATPSNSSLQNPSEIFYNQTGNFQIQHIIQFAGCRDTFLTGLTVVPVPSFELGTDTLLCDDEFIELDAFVPGASGYIWNDGFSGQKRKITEGGWHRVEVDFRHCQLRDSIFVEFQSCDQHIYVPSAFSPNNDGINDVFEIFHEGVDNLKVQIFNRWGGLLYDSSQTSGNWDGTFKGKPMESGVYVYLINYNILVTGEAKIKAGDFLLIR